MYLFLVLILNKGDYLLKKNLLNGKSKSYSQALIAGADKNLGYGKGPVMHFFNTWEK